MRGGNPRKLGCVPPSETLVQLASFEVLGMLKRTYSLPLKSKTGASGHALRDEVLQNLAGAGA